MKLVVLTIHHIDRHVLVARSDSSLLEWIARSVHVVDDEPAQRGRQREERQDGPVYPDGDLRRPQVFDGEQSLDLRLIHRVEGQVGERAADEQANPRMSNRWVRVEAKNANSNEF